MDRNWCIDSVQSPNRGIRHATVASLSLHKVVDHIARCAGQVSLRESSDHLLLRDENREIIERRRVSDIVFDIVHHKFHFVPILARPLFRSVQRTRLTPPFIIKAPTIDRLAADHQIAFAHNYRSKAIALDFVNSLSYEIDFRFWFSET